MTVNHGGTLGKEYFISYLSLIMNSRGCSAEEAHDIAFHLFFKGNEDAFGQKTYQEFLTAYAIMNDNGG
ncbi:hypothetical protein [Bacillus sp. SG-1]|uniref:hypothetical protein n=1 Tax=Bacillus sp. SG-1 TaxID=161544 RepID=UPI0001543346|nr:hypothetical protein [Bacillus sp. SG-1]EDL66110.1 hypothetical protein BSG1_02120 [Bacillus sp. SG-1]